MQTKDAPKTFAAITKRRVEKNAAFELVEVSIDPGAV
jgi:hypothetical protein